MKKIILGLNKFVALFLVVFLVGCGGGGGDGGNPAISAVTPVVATVITPVVAPAVVRNLVGAPISPPVVVPVVPVTLYSISGTVTGAGVSPVTVNMTVVANSSTISAPITGYSFAGLVSGNYTLTPVSAGYTFVPSSITVNLASNMVVPFIAVPVVPLAYSIAGSVKTATGVGIAGVTVALTPAGVTAITDGIGNYSFPNVLVGAYTVTPTLVGSTMTPLNTPVAVVNASVAGINFTTILPVLTTGTLYYPCTNAICSENLAVAPLATTILWSGGTVYPDILSLFSGGANIAYTGGNMPGVGGIGSGIAHMSLATPTVQTLVLMLNVLAPGCSAFPQGSFDVGQSSALTPPVITFAAVALNCTVVGGVVTDIFLVNMDGTNNYIRVTNDTLTAVVANPTANLSPVVTGADVAGNVTVAFYSNKAGVTGLWKQIVNVSPASVVALIGPQVLVDSSAVAMATNAPTRGASFNASGTHLAYMKNVGGVSHIVVAPLAGGVSVDLGIGSSPYFWSSAGIDKVLFNDGTRVSAGTNLLMVNKDGTGLMSVPIPANLNSGLPSPVLPSLYLLDRIIIK